jgi:hypothetical protein
MKMKKVFQKSKNAFVSFIFFVVIRPFLKRLPRRRLAALPKVEGSGGDGGRVFFGDVEEAGEERGGFFFEAEEMEGAENAGEAEVVVIVGNDPVVGATLEIGRAHDSRVGAGESVEVEHHVERVQKVSLVLQGSAEGADGGVVERWSVGVEDAGSIEREKPLNEVVVKFEVVGGEGPDVGEKSAGVVGGFVAIEGNKGHGALRSSFDSPNHHNDRGCEGCWIVAEIFASFEGIILAQPGTELQRGWATARSRS